MAHNGMTSLCDEYEDVLGHAVISHATSVRLDLVEDGAVYGTGPEELPPVLTLSLPSTAQLPTLPLSVTTKLTSSGT